MKAGGGAEHDYEDETVERPVKKSNVLPIWGNEKTMNLNPLILTNIQSSQYFKVNLYQLKTYHEVIDEIYYKVNHLEPWEKGSRKTSGQTGMCGGVRGVGAGGIVSTAFCILYKLYTLKLTRKQVQGLINHSDSPYIRGLGFMYIRFTQPPADLWEWFESYLEDEEEIDVRAGGGQSCTIGQVVRHMLTKLEWHSTLFPRIPVPIQKDIEKRLSDKGPANVAHSVDRYNSNRDFTEDPRRRDETNGEFRRNREYQERDDRDRREREEKFKERDHREKDKYRDRPRERSPDRTRERDHDRDRRSSRERDRHHRHHHRHTSSRSHHRNHRERSYSYEIEREKERIKRDKRKSRSRSRSRDKSRRHRDY